MRNSLQERIQRVDWWGMASVGILTVFGLMLIHSLTWPQDNRFVKQLIFLGISLVLVVVIQFFDAHFWRNASLILYATIIVLLLGLLLFGEATRGTRGWIGIWALGFQPAEFAKLATILILATTIERLHFDLSKARHVVLVLVIIGLPVLLTVLQPDIGSAFIILLAGVAMILYTGLDRKKLMLLTLMSVFVLAIGWFGLLKDYQKERVLTFMSPQSDPLGAGYNVNQAIVAIGSGGFFGRGLGLGTQSQLDFLPEQETDFIFASLAEELGFITASGLLLIYVIFLWRLYSMLKAGTRPFYNFYLLGIFVMFLSQSAINIGMNMGLFPVTGITLPFVSYGGSSLVANFASLGIAMSMKARV
jgi:rod shape determining protein RodA